MWGDHLRRGVVDFEKNSPVSILVSKNSCTRPLAKKKHTMYRHVPKEKYFLVHERRI